jgi:outer membrane immunogenic protein
MHKLLLRLALVSVAFIPAASALAADLEVAPPPPPVEDLRPATYDWSGAYAGLLIGASCIDGTLTENVAGPPASTIVWENSGCGWKGGALAGYNHQMDDIVLGFEADWMRSNYLAENRDIGPTSAADFEFGFDHEITLRARAGLAMDDTLLFVTGGGAWARGAVHQVGGSTFGTVRGDQWGWTIGAGVEHAVTDQFRLKLDYLYTNFGKGDYTEACCDLDIDIDNHEFRLGAIWAW